MRDLGVGKTLGFSSREFEFTRPTGDRQQMHTMFLQIRLSGIVDG
jgi:hypothetical protein